jgi:thymidine kinase
MAKLYFRYGQMNASKSIQLLTVAHNYEEQGKVVILFTPAIDSRYGEGKITSRVGISRDAYMVHEDTNLYELAEKKRPDCILVDEAQFLRGYHIRQFANIVDALNIPVIMYGLLKDYRNQLFEGSEAAILLSDQIEEIKTICADKTCNRKATMILKIKDGKPVYSGQQIEIGGNELYHSVCRRHYFQPDLKMFV